ncbi:MAG: hypothetical protein NC301_05315 [Bacteroides sp.]|nr:hypothetical protein [Bacteroides sp.]MCM1379742.1 hypothetical protein [Bacteroides sp.]MCM1445717.1 hypothetical protein [Prevotella sp.]
MTKINLSDKLFVTVSDHGLRLLNITLSGFSSLKELMQHLAEMLHQYRGKLLTFELRNSTQGWSRENQLLLAA